MIEVLLEAERALSFGLLDQAERLYRQAATGDPRNAIAVVGLARVALERGDDGAALALARRALVIDPENDAARRMVDRLVEVRRHRGESTEPELDDEAVVRVEPPDPVKREPEPAAEPEPELEPPAEPAAKPESEPKRPPAAEPDTPTAPAPAPETAEPPRRPGLLRRLLRRG